MRVFRTLLLAALILATPFRANAQFGGAPGELPGGPWTPPPARPSAPPPACQQLLTLRDETQKHGIAIQKANERKANVQDACKLFKSYLAAEAKFIRGLEDNSRTCGVPADAIKQAREGHAKASQTGKQVCEEAARGPGPASSIPWDALRQDRRKPDQFRDYEDNCRDCGKIGDFWWTVPPPGPR
jgi:hypothetical protein